jgi:hypothetical protein
MKGLPFHLNSCQQMVIHDRPDGSECCVKKPQTLCPCGEYQVTWLHIPEPKHHWTMQEWIRGEDVSPEPK